MRTLRILFTVVSVAGCSDSVCSDATWRASRSDLNRSALAFWGNADDNLYVVGGSLGAPGGSLAMRWDGEAWTELPMGSGETLWWVWGTSDGSDVWMVGENGTILRWDGTQAEEVASGTTAHLYGVWGTSPSDVWIVGGRPGPEEGPDDVLLHWNGTVVETVAGPAPRGAALFKVWGASADELLAVGEYGTIYHKTAAGWTDESVETLATVSTVHGCAADDVWAVAGQAVYSRAGGAWQVADVDVLGNAAGVTCSAGAVLARVADRRADRSHRGARLPVIS